MRLHNVLYAVIFLLYLFARGVAGAVYPLLENGPITDQINIVLVAEGYTATQESQFIADANNMLSYMLAQPPLNYYFSYYNGYAIFVSSNESGADHPSAGIYKDTYLNSSFDSYGIQRLITIPPNDFDFDPSHGQMRLYSLLADNLPEYDIIVIVVNDNMYGGSGGAYAITSVNISSPEIIVHEVGHSFGLLADEYAYTKSISKLGAYPNVTQQTDLALIPWEIWVDGGTPVPTPDQAPYLNTIGLFQGANYDPILWYRPKHICKMKVLGVSFCEVCSEAIVLANYRLLSTITGHLPQTPTFVMNVTEQETLYVNPHQLLSSSYAIDWFVNGELTGVNSVTYVVDGPSIGLGTFDISVVVSDTTSFVRNDPFGLLQDSVLWTVLVVNPPCCVGVRGNVDDVTGPGGDVDVSDVTFLVNYLFRSGPIPPCTSEANIDGLIGPGGEIDVSDLTYLIAYLFESGPPPAPCL